MSGHGEAGAAGAGTGVEPPKADELALAHRALLATVARLEEAMDQATTPDQIATLADRVGETNARATRLGARLLVAQTAAVTEGARAIRAAAAEVDDAIAAMDDQRKVIAGVTRLLRVADAAIEAVGRAA